MMPATSEPRTREEMLTRRQMALIREERAAQRARVARARTIAERSRVALERMRRTEAGRCALIQFTPPAPEKRPPGPVEAPESQDQEGAPRAPRQIIAAIAREFGVTSNDIVGPGRTQAVINARFAAVAAVATEHPGMSVSQIGRLFGERDHSTILHALRKMDVRAASSVDPVAPVDPGDADSPEDLVRRIAEAHGLTVQEIRGANQSARSITARRAVIVALKIAHPDMPASAIGLLVDRNPSSVLMVLRRAGVRPAAAPRPTSSPLAAEGSRRG